MRKFRKSIQTEKQAFRNLASSLILFEKVTTTEAKAKALRPIVERIITKSKDDNLVNRRYIFSFLVQKEAALKTFEQLSKRYKERPGGYTRIIKLGQRNGDAAPTAEISLVE